MLPNVNQLAAQIHERVQQSNAASLEKTAAANPPREFTIPAAQSLSKLARTLRENSVDAVTYDDLRSFCAMIGH